MLRDLWKCPRLSDCSWEYEKILKWDGGLKGSFSEEEIVACRIRQQGTRGVTVIHCPG